MTSPVAVAVQRLFCYHGADEGVSEPYLWTIGFTIDGRTITHAENSPVLTGSPGYFFSPSSHGSIGGGVGIGANRQIPPAVGRFNTTLQPIVLHVAGQSFEVPGQIGLIAVLLEENATSDAGAEAAHQAINNLVQVEVDEAVADINLAGIAALIATGVAGGQTPEEAAIDVFAVRIEILANRIQRYARAVAVDAIVSNLSFPSVIVEGANPDEFMGVGVHFYSEQELGPTSNTSRIDFTDVMSQPGVAFLESSDYVYNLHGQAWKRVTYSTSAITEDVPPGRWQVTGVNYGHTRRKSFISHIGGTFADGAPWQLPKGKAMDLIVAGTHTFFVRGQSGLEAEVIIQPDPVSQYFPSITTAADSDPSNNLRNLPLCPLSVTHETPFD